MSINAFLLSKLVYTKSTQNWLKRAKNDSKLTRNRLEFSSHTKKMIQLDSRGSSRVESSHFLSRVITRSIPKSKEGRTSEAARDTIAWPTLTRFMLNQDGKKETWNSGRLWTIPEATKNFWASIPRERPRDNWVHHKYSFQRGKISRLIHFLWDCTVG